MKKTKNLQKKNFLKKIFIKFCRILGFEIIDQANFNSPTLAKNLNETLSVPGNKSITLPLGQLNIKRKIKGLKIILRTCTSELIKDQNKRRLFNCEKNEYTFRTLKSIIKAVQQAKNTFKNIKFEIIVTDTNSSQNDISIIKRLLSQSNIDTKFFSIDLKSYESKIKSGYSKAKFSNMANFYNSLLMAKNEGSDVIYFVEDDYIHASNSITEMIFSYEKFATIFKNDPILLPSDYPYLYTKDEATKVYLGERYHWRLVSESLVTFMTSKSVIENNFKNLETMGIEWIDPWEKPLHDIYKNNPCLSPLPSLAFHCANINSVFGLSPNINWKKLWDENKV